VSYNIDTITVVEAWDLSINGLQAFRLTRGEQGPSNSFLDDLTDEFESILAADQKLSEVELPIKCFRWSGEGSGSSWPFFVEKVAPYMRGRLRAIVAWEGGDSIEVIQVLDGVFQSVSLADVLRVVDLDAVFRKTP